MEIGGLGLTEIIILLLVFGLGIAGPILLIIALVLFFSRRKKANARMKKCAFCGYSIPVEATFCQFCGRGQGNQNV